MITVGLIYFCLLLYHYQFNRESCLLSCSSQVKWHEVCLHVPAAIKEVLLAWEHGAVTPTDVKRILDAMRSRMCCLPVCAAAWLCSYMQVSVFSYRNDLWGCACFELVYNVIIWHCLDKQVTENNMHTYHIFYTAMKSLNNTAVIFTTPSACLSVCISSKAAETIFIKFDTCVSTCFCFDKVGQE